MLGKTFKSYMRRMLGCSEPKEPQRASNIKKQHPLVLLAEAQAQAEAQQELYNSQDSQESQEEGERIQENSSLKPLAVNTDLKPPPKSGKCHPLEILADIQREPQKEEEIKEKSSANRLVTNFDIKPSSKAGKCHPLEIFAEVQQESDKNEVKEKTLTITTRPPGISDQLYYTITHPVYRKYGDQVYNSHAFIEQLLGIASCPDSLKIHPHLKLLEKGIHENAEDPFLWTPQAFKLYLEEESSHRDSLERLHFLGDIFRKLSNDYENKALSENELTTLNQEILRLITGCFSQNTTSEIQFLKDESFNLENVLPYIQDDTLDFLLDSIFRDMLHINTKANLRHEKELLSEITLLENLLSKESRVVKSFVNHKNYMPDLDDPSFDKTNLFGSFLSMTAFPDEFKTDIFFKEHIGEMKTPQKIQEISREKIHKAVDGVYRIMKIIMKADSNYKKCITDWFYLSLEGYQTRFTTYQNNPYVLVSNKGCFMNFLMLLLKFSQDPLKDIFSYPNWLTKVDIRYLQERPIFMGMSLLNGLPNQYNPSETKHSFFTELVFILSHALEQYQKLIEIFDKVTQQLLLNFDTRSQLKLTIYTGRFGFEVHMDDPCLLEQILKFVTFQALYVLNSFDISVREFNNLPQIFVSTKDIKKANFEFKPSLPFDWIDDIMGIAFYLKNADRGVFLKHSLHLEILMDFFLSLLSNSQWIEAFHIRGKAVSLIRALTLIKDDIPAPQFASIFVSNPYYRDQILQSLLELFIGTEKTVGKHSIRAECCQLLGYIFKETSLTEQNLSNFDSLNKENPNLLLKFGMLYVGDLSFLLDESLQRIGEINTHQSRQMPQDGYGMYSDEQNSLMINLETVSSYLFIFQKYYEMASWLTQFPVNFLLSSEVRDLFTGNLNYTLHTLLASSYAGNSQKNQANNGDFNPTNLLKSVLRIYLNMYKRNEFLESVVSDVRSFDIKLFLRMPVICQKNQLLNGQELFEWKNLTSQLQQKMQEKQQADKLFSEAIVDIPEEFMDPLVNEVMRDPVMLPSSKVVVDRTTISKYLLNDTIDPFNRSLLTKDMLIPVPDLKEKIKEFFRSKQEKMK